LAEQGGSQTSPETIAQSANMSFYQKNHSNMAASGMQNSIQ
jgi:hypothetical protein